MPDPKPQPAAGRPFAKRVTLMDVCRAAGVSKATISNVVNDKPGVGPELRQKIRDLIKKMGYVPRPAARHLSWARTDTIAVVFQDLTPGWQLNIYRAILMEAALTRYFVVTALSLGPNDEFELPTRVLGTASVDGLLWLDPRATPELINRFKDAQPMPFVVIQGHVEIPDITTISTENTQGAYRAVKHLLGLGYRRLMLITGQEENVDSQEKLAGARQALREAGVSVPADYILNGHHMAWYARRAMNEFETSARPLPEAIFAFNDTMALAVMQWLREKGRRVPEDVAVVGFDGIDEAEHAELTTVETPMREMGTLATRMLIELIHTRPEERKGRHITLGGTLRVRKSCGAHLRQASPPGP